jgi:hypothetical protein
MSNLAVPGLPGRLHVVDIRNYSLKLDTTDRDVMRLAEETRRVASDMVSGPGSEQGAGATANSRVNIMGLVAVSFLKHTVLVHTNDEALKLEREAIWGGRCEAFVLGAAPGKFGHLTYVRAIRQSLCLRGFLRGFFTLAPADYLRWSQYVASQSAQSRMSQLKSRHRASRRS